MEDPINFSDEYIFFVNGISVQSMILDYSSMSFFKLAETQHEEQEAKAHPQVEIQSLSPQPHAGGKLDEVFLELCS